MALLDNRYPDRAHLGGGADGNKRWRRGVTEQEREELIEQMARDIGAACGYRITPWRYRIVKAHARAALDVAEPVIREECARIADREANVNTGFETSDFLDGIAFGARVIAAAIR